METTQNAQTQEVDVSSVYVPEYAREVSPEGQDKITRDIQEKGLIQEIVVAEMPEGRKELVAGQRRFKAVQALGWKTIRARVLPLGTSELDKELVRIAENEEREDVNPFDRAQSYDRAIKAGATQQELADKLGMAKQTISNMLTLLVLSPEVTAEYRRRDFSGAHLQELVRLPDAQSQLKMADACDKAGWSSKVLRDKVSRALAGGPKEASKDVAEGSQPQAEEGPFQFVKKGKFLNIRTAMPANVEEVDEVYMRGLRIALADFLMKEARMEQAAFCKIQYQSRLFSAFTRR